MIRILYNALSNVIANYIHITTAIYEKAYLNYLNYLNTLVLNTKQNLSQLPVSIIVIVSYLREKFIENSYNLT